MTKQQQLDQLKDKILADGVCPDLAATATQLVFGDGAPDAKIVFIGEAPGKNEDIQGVPFVGAAGKFLNEMLSYIDLKRENIYITNIVKYRPPNNRDPLPEEKLAFLPYLQAQLEIIQPTIVVTLGRHSMNCFLPDLQISQVHGRPKRIRVKRLQTIDNNAQLLGSQDGDKMQGRAEHRTEPYKSTAKEEAETVTQQIAPKFSGETGSARQSDELILVILPLFHPAAALYNGGMRQTLIDDFMKIPAIIEQIETK